VAALVRFRPLLAAAVCLILTITLAVLAGDRPAQAAQLPSGFQEKAVLTGLTAPTSVEFSRDGRVFVAEKSGLVKVFDSLNDPAPSVYADLREQVHNYWDRGLLGLALHPKFPTDPRIYVLYTRNAELGGVAPRWPTTNGTDDDCPTPPGGTDAGCVVSGRLSVLRPAQPAEGGQDAAPVTEVPLLDGWCAQFPGHHVGTIAFGADGMLYAGSGDGASFVYADWGQRNNACGDPDKPKGTGLAPPTSQGGALRAQDVRTQGDPTGLNSTIVRVDPETGQPAPGNPAQAGDANTRRIIAYGLRNPYRFTFRPGTNDLWIGDVGNWAWEEIDRVPNPAAGPVPNFGWPCYEGPMRQRAFDAADLDLCESLYRAGPSAVKQAFYQYDHGAKTNPADNCQLGSSGVSGISFYRGDSYPGFKNALFFADYSRLCIWALKATNGLPDPAKVVTFAGRMPYGVVELQAGHGGDLYGVDFLGGRLVRYVYTGANNPPDAAIQADRSSGALPLTVQFDGTGSTDADGDRLTYSWDLNGDGRYGDSADPRPSRTYQARERVNVGLIVEDGRGGSDRTTTTIHAGNTPPVATITSPAQGTTWRVGQTIDYAGTASDPDGPLPADAVQWQTIMHHCPAQCHQHVISGSGGGTGRFVAPDHEYPSWIELKLTVTDADGQSDTKSVRLDPKVAKLSLRSNPPGIPLTVFSQTRKAPYDQRVVAGSNVSLSAPTNPQWVDGQLYEFVGWSNGKPSAHNITATGDATLTANYRRVPNLALRKPTRASSTQAGYSPVKAFDGSLTTRWASRASRPQWIQVDLGARKQLRRVVTRWERAYAKHYRIFVSNDGRQWTRVFITTRADGGIENIVFPARTARYVRVLGDVRANASWGFSLWEFEVYNR
jgi:glucose/arabinose dehydrogenase